MSSQESLNMEALWGSLFVSVLSHPGERESSSLATFTTLWSHAQVMDQGEVSAPLIYVVFPPFASVSMVPLTQQLSALEDPDAVLWRSRLCVFWKREERAWKF